MRNKHKRVDKETRLTNYSMLNGTYDKRLASIQTVIIINTTFSAAIIVVLGVQLNLFAPLSETKALSQNIAATILSFVAFVEGLCSDISICHLAYGCGIIRKELYCMERELNLYPLHKKNNIGLSIAVTIFCVSLTVLVFFVCSLIGLFKILWLFHMPLSLV